MKIIKKIAVVLLVILVVLQFIRPDKNLAEGDVIADFRAETQLPKNIENTLERACFDCHSNRTQYPWYAEIAPVSYWIAGHVNEGKEHLSFSDWATYTAKRKDHKLEELAEEVQEKHMPLESYLWIHDEAKLSEADITAIVNWANQARSAYPSSQEREE